MNSAILDLTTGLKGKDVHVKRMSCGCNQLNLDYWGEKGHMGTALLKKI